MTELVGHLMRLGLSEYEARAYIATVALGEGTVKEISVESGVPRSRAYDVMEHLAERGFVQLGNSNPICYRASEPLVASSQLMEEIKHANEEVVRELSEIGQRADKTENPIWTLKGEWAIGHKITELLSSAQRSIVVICFNNSHIIRYAKILAEKSKKLDVTVALAQDAESFFGLLGRTRVMRMNSPMPHVPEMEGELLEGGFLTMDGRYCIELIIVVDKEAILALSKEKDVRRAIVITGTIMSLFAMETIGTVINNSEEVALPKRPHLRRS